MENLDESTKNITIRKSRTKSYKHHNIIQDIHLEGTYSLSEETAPVTPQTSITEDTFSQLQDLKRQISELKKECSEAQSEIYSLRKQLQEKNN